jgi:hypothetical protein
LIIFIKLNEVPHLSFLPENVIPSADANCITFQIWFRPGPFA